REDRWQSAEVLVQQLESLATPSGGTQSVKGVKRSRSWIYFGAAAAVVAGTALWVWERANSNGPVVTATSRQLTFSGRAYAAAISPNGQYVAYTEDSAYPVQRLFVQEVMGGQPIERGTGIYGTELHWSGDGKDVVMYEGLDTAFSTWVVPVIGGAPRRLSRHYALESPDGRRVAEVFDSLGDAVRLRDLGTEFSETLTVHFRGSATGAWAWSPTGRAIASLVFRKESASIESMTIDGKDTQVLIGPETAPLAFAWVSGAIYYLRRNGTAVQLWKIPVSSETGVARGRPALIIPALDRGNEDLATQSGSSEFSIAADGSRLVYIRAVPRGNLFALSVRPGSEIAPTARQLTTGTRTIGGMHLSPDGGTVLFSAGVVGSIDIFVMSVDGGPARQLTFMTFRTGANFAWSPDGKQIAFCAEDGSGWHVWTMAALGGTPRKLSHTRAAPWCFIAWGPGQHIIYIGTGPNSGPSGGHPRVLDLATEHEQPLEQDDSVGYMNAPQISPDGKRVAVYWDRPDREGLWNLSLVDSAQQFLTAGAVPMRWSARGDAIFAYRGHDVLRVPAGGGVVSVVARLPPDWICLDQDISPDGSRLVCSRDETQRDAWMIENFDPDVPAAKP
ncbi:MAG TPA: hypothetical protein VFP39_13025, partial [Gemmatimonadales bacterium]|nr:hypothetical protein [Gemmatimonadales bacterium]